MSSKLGELCVLFLRLGLTAFGGPAAHIAIMEDEVVRRRRWVTPERFLDLLGASNLIPGPSSTELAMFIGFEQAGWLGLLAGGGCFILPAALLVGAIAWAYVRFGALPQVGSVLYGIKPVVIAVVLHALWGLAPKAIKKSRGLALVGVAVCAASALGVDALAVLVGAGIVMLVARRVAEKRDEAAPLFVGPVLTTVAGAAPAGGVVMLFLTFLKIGAVVFGSGYVLLAFLRADVVNRMHWLTEAQLLDAVAIGQVTPGPVFTTATFIGYVVARGPGAVAATLGIFLPGFALVALVRPLVAKARKSPTLGALLDGVNVAALGLMAVVTAQLARAALVDATTVGVAVIAAVLLIRFKINATWLVAGGALVGLLAHVLHASVS
jgi:chromate transporter